MNQPTPKYRGQCDCGSIQYQFTDLPFDADYCHCRQCQRTTGSVVSVWMDFKVGQVQWLTASAKEYASSEFIRRGFCEQCGCSVSYRHLQHPDYISLSIATLDDPDLIEPKYHIYTSSQPSWLKIDDNCPKHRYQRNGERR